MSVQTQQSPDDRSLYYNKHWWLTLQLTSWILSCWEKPICQTHYYACTLSNAVLNKMHYFLDCSQLDFSWSTYVNSPGHCCTLMWIKESEFPYKYSCLHKSTAEWDFLSVPYHVSRLDEQWHRFTVQWHTAPCNFHYLVLYTVNSFAVHDDVSTQVSTSARWRCTQQKYVTMEVSSQILEMVRKNNLLIWNV